MELEQLIVWAVCLACGLLWFRAIALPRSQGRGWALVSGGILATTLAAMYFVPNWAAWWAGGLWVTFVLIPLVGVKQIDRLYLGQQYARASQLASGLCYLHPADGWLEKVQILRGMALADAGNLAGAKQLLNPTRSLRTSVDLWAVALWYSINADWTGLLTWLRLKVSSSGLRNSPDLMAFYLRALGETGQLDELIQEWDSGESRWVKQGVDAQVVDRLRLYVWAFSGRLGGVQHCLNGGGRVYSRQMQQFWLATAQLATPQRTEGRRRLMELQCSARFPLQQAIAWRLSRPPAPLKLTPVSLKILSRLAADPSVKIESSLGISPSPVYATFLLIAMNLVVYGFEVYLGGSQNPQVLDQLGAMVPEQVWDGQWWRLGSGMFLHFGFGHLAMNMLGLYVLGLSVEPKLGRPQYVVTYLSSGVGSMLVTAILWRMQQESSETFVVGASGAVMGLLGALAAILLESWREHKTRFALERLHQILLVFGAQTIFDWLNPQICFVCHASGAILGLAIATVLLRMRQFR